MRGIVGFVSKRKNNRAAEKVGRTLDVPARRGAGDASVEVWKTAK